MPEPFYTVCRVLHVGGGWLAFAAAPLALLAVKGGRLHILAGRCFVLSMATGVAAALSSLGSIGRPARALTPSS